MSGATVSGLSGRAGKGALRGEQGSPDRVGKGRTESEIYPVSRVKPGDRLARPIYGPAGQLLLTKGAVLTEAEIGKLVSLGVPAVYIDSGDVEGVYVDDVVRAEVKAEASKALAEAFQRISQGAVVRANDLRRACQNLLDEILEAHEPTVSLVDIRTLNDHTLGHSVGVCILSLILGRRMGLDYGSLKDLGMGALLHDVGRAIVPPEVWFKAGPLTEEEWEAVRGHPRRGFEVLKEIEEIRVLSRHVAYQHHERLDGSGYPLGLLGEGIHRFARIAAVADVYDALTQNRPYRPELAPHHALRYLKTHAGTLFDADVVGALLRSVAPFPVGTRVLLDDGSDGVVEEVKPRDLANPILRLPDGERVDLAETGQKILKVLSGWDAGLNEDAFPSPGTHTRDDVSS